MNSAAQKTEQHWIQSVIWIVVGIASASLGIKGFLLPNGFIDGGVTGVSMLMAQLSHWPISIFLLVFNIPFLILGYFQLGLRFTLMSALAIFGLALSLFWLPFPQVATDTVLGSVFGGFFLGAGIGLAMRGEAVLDGTEIAALLISKTNSWLRVSDVILLFNIGIFTAAAFFLSIETALYAILTYFSASRTIHFILHGIEEYTAVIIVSPEHAAIRAQIITDLKRTVTVYKGEGGLSQQPQDILYCVITKLEMGVIKAVAHQHDAQAFLIFQPLADVEGGMVKRPALH